MQMTSERDVVFTPFMLRVRAKLDGDPSRAEPRMRPSSLKPIAGANDEWFYLRAWSEQVLAEANAMLRGRSALIDLEDEVGTGRLAFRLRRGDRTVRVSLTQTGRQAWVELDRSYARSNIPTEPADPEVLEDIVLELIESSDG